MQHDFILLDRSGSMQALWSEALHSVNAYVKKLAEDQIDTGVTLATFDKDGEQFKFEIDPRPHHPFDLEAGIERRRHSARHDAAQRRHRPHRHAGQSRDLTARRTTSSRSSS